MNKNGGVCLALGRHLKGSSVANSIPNTVIVDIAGLTEEVRVIGIYWPQGQARNLDDFKPFITKNTIITGDFNATVLEWGSPETDKR
ncbi:unnamed protein product, partial [Didymodactylos carnosus]